MPRIFLTQELVDNLIKKANVKKVDYFDSQCKGLCLEVRPKGATWYYRYKGQSRVRQFRIGNLFQINLEQARLSAIELTEKVKQGLDPAAEKDLEKSSLTFGFFIRDRYIPYIKSYKRSWSTDECLLRNHVLPKFSKMKMSDITKADVMQMHQKRLADGASASSANRLLILVRYCFNLALKWEIPHVHKNPTLGIPLFKENNARERYLTTDELNQLFVEIQRSANPMLQFIIPMLALTGARKGEVLTARWQDISINNKIWKIPISKSGKARFVPLADAVLKLLERVPKYEGCPYIFPNPRTMRPYKAIFYSWHTARTNVGLEDVRIHDLRHTYASLLINNGRSLYEVQKILGHSQITTTQRYSHLSDITLIEAANVAADKIDLPD